MIRKYYPKLSPNGNVLRTIRPQDIVPPPYVVYNELGEYRSTAWNHELPLIRKVHPDWSIQPRHPSPTASSGS